VDPRRYVERVVAHVREFWPDGELDVLAWTIGPLWEQAPQMRFVELGPAERGGTWTYLSAGAAPLLEDEGVGHEFVIRAPFQERLMVELLAMAVYYAWTGDHGGVHDGHTLNHGEPWIEGADASFLYVNKPYFVSHRFERLPYGDGHTAQFLWLVPITEAEKDWRHAHGQEAFEQLLEERRIDPTDPARAPVVP